MIENRLPKPRMLDILAKKYKKFIILFLKLSQSDWEKVHSSSFSEILSGRQPFKIPHACFCVVVGTFKVSFKYLFSFVIVGYLSSENFLKQEKSGHF